MADASAGLAAQQLVLSPVRNRTSLCGMTIPSES